MKDSRVSKISFIDRVRQAKCYHCGQSSAKSMYRVKYFGPKIIEVCDSCKDKYHKFGNRVVVYVNDNMSADRPYFDDFVSQNIGLIDTVHRVSVDSRNNDGNIIAQALLETVELYGIPTYFAVPSINTFDGIGELVRVINSVRTKNCVFYAHEERIDSSTNEGKSIINAITTAYNMETDRYSRNLKKARDTKRLIKEYGNSDEPIDAIVKQPHKKPIKKGETPNEFWTALAQLRNGTITLKDAAAMCNMCVTTFKSRCKQFNV